MRAFLLAVGCVFLFGGCASFPKTGEMSLKNPFSSKDKKPDPYPNPVKMAVMWTPDTLTTAGKRPTRGFGARIFFYDEKSRPVPVEGELTVVAYEESDNPSVAPKVRRFGFTKEQFTEHFSQSDLGASYSVWIPWDVDGGLGQRITMVPTFQSSEAKSPIQGTATAVLLPGPMPEQRAIDEARRVAASGAYGTQSGMMGGAANGVQQVTFDGQNQLQPGSQPRSGLNTLTIPVDGRFNRGIAR